MKSANLLVPKREKWTTNPGKEQRSKPRTASPNEFWGTDMTKVLIPGRGWGYVHVVIDWGSKKLLSLHASTRSRAVDWQAALDEALNAQFPQGIAEIPEGKRPFLVSDHGCQPTSKSYKKIL